MVTAIYHDIVTGIGASNVYENVIPVLNPNFVSSTILSQSGSTVTSFEFSVARPSFYDIAVFDGAFTANGNGFFSGTVSQYTSMATHYQYGTATIADYYYTNFTIDQYAAYGANNDGLGFVQFLFRGNDVIQGRTAGDTLLGYDGDDVIWGSAPDATVDGGDVLLGNRGSDVIYGGDGDDSLVGGSALVDADDSRDILYGGNGNDDIYGSAGDDVIHGGAGRDLIVGGADNDLLSGGTGNDTFVFVRGGAYDTVTDFQQGDIITIERTSLVTNASTALANITSDIYGSFINLGNGSGITLAGVQPADLDASDFYFYG